MRSSSKQLLRKAKTHLSKVEAHVTPLSDALFIAIDCIQVIGYLDPEHLPGFKDHTVKITAFHLAEWLNESEMEAVQSLFDQSESQARRQLRQFARLIPSAAALNIVTSVAHGVKTLVGASHYDQVNAALKSKWKKQGLIRR